MEDNTKLFNFINQVFATFGIIVLFFLILGYVVGESVSMYSTLFAFGKEGFSTATLLQLLFMSVIISIGREIFLTDHWIKNLIMLWRNVCFFVVVIIAVVLFVGVFEWFPIDDVKAWISFFLSFSVCTVIGIIISRIKEQAEDKKMAQALDRFRKNK